MLELSQGLLMLHEEVAVDMHLFGGRFADDGGWKLQVVARQHRPGRLQQRTPAGCLQSLYATTGTHNQGKREVAVSCTSMHRAATLSAVCRERSHHDK